MAKFDLKKAILENKATFFSSLTEGQFSWMTQDTGEQIGSQDENQIPVYMFDDKGNKWLERKYDGYGKFGGKDYYDLVAEMNGYTADDAEEFGGMFKDLRGIGINLSSDKLETKNENGDILFPALVTRPNFNWKSHDFTQEPKNDPNQSWLAPEEDDFYDQNDEEEYGYNDDEDDEDNYDYSNDYNENNEDEYIGDNDSEYDTGVDEGKKKYYKDAEADDAEHIKALEKDMKDDKKSGKMKMSELTAKIREMVLNEMESNNMEDAPENEVDFLAEIEGMLDENASPTKDTIQKKYNEMFGKNPQTTFADVAKALNTTEQDIASSLFITPGGPMFEANKKNTEEEEVEDDVTDGEETVDVTDDFSMEEPQGPGKIDVTQNANADLTGTKKDVQDNLEAALEAARALGDEKLATQVGNTITFFNKQHVVKDTPVAEGKKMEEGYFGANNEVEELMDALEYETMDEFFSDNPGVVTAILDWAAGVPEFKSKMETSGLLEAKKEDLNEAEGKLVDEKTGEEVILPYETLDFRGDPMTVISFRAPHKPSSTGRIYIKGGGEYFPSVAGLKIIDHSFSEDLNESMFPMLKRILK